jgi:hypothetical protein
VYESWPKSTWKQSIARIVPPIERVFLPHVEANKRPSTAKAYRDVWEDQLQIRIADTLLRSVRTSMVQSWLENIAAQDKTKAGTPLRRETLKRIKSALSGIFKDGKTAGLLRRVESRNR